MDKIYCLVYTGTCSSIFRNGIKFTNEIRTAPVTVEKAMLFRDAAGNSLYDDIRIQEIKKEEILPESKKEYTVESLKQKNTLDQLQAMATERNLDTDGSKTELAERIVEFEKSE